MFIGFILTKKKQQQNMNTIWLWPQMGIDTLTHPTCRKRWEEPNQSISKFNPLRKNTNLIQRILINSIHIQFVIMFCYSELRSKYLLLCIYIYYFVFKHNNNWH